MAQIVAFFLGSAILRMLIGAGISITTYTIINDYVAEATQVISNLLSSSIILPFVTLLGLPTAFGYILSALNAAFIIKSIKGIFKINFN